MRQPVLLCYNLKDESFRKVRLAAMRFKIRIRPVPPAEYGETLAALCGMEPPAGLPAPGTFADEMLVMAHLSSLQASQFLQSLRRLGVPPIALKATEVLIAPNGGNFSPVGAITLCNCFITSLGRLNAQQTLERMELQDKIALEHHIYL